MIRVSGMSLCIVVCAAALSVGLGLAAQAAETAPSTLDLVRRAVADQADLQVDQVNADAAMADLGLDDLDVVEVVMALEDELGIEISEPAGQATGHRRSRRVRRQRGRPGVTTPGSGDSRWVGRRR